MNKTEFLFLQSEKGTLIHLLETAPKDAVISCMSLQKRLDKVEALLQQYSATFSITLELQHDSRTERR